MRSHQRSEDTAVQVCRLECVSPIWGCHPADLRDEICRVDRRPIPLRNPQTRTRSRNHSSPFDHPGKDKRKQPPRSVSAIEQPGKSLGPSTGSASGRSAMIHFPAYGDGSGTSTGTQGPCLRRHGQQRTSRSRPKSSSLDTTWWRGWLRCSGLRPRRPQTDSAFALSQRSETSRF
ncbi:hypothetical protein VTK73DRAFT_1777 [Phialemonium thermophilum]|uniref:Uncharacterized protein n=1 Tax=Phialemonium thermophilum TaxID=223376 RepID=A0ABR3X7V0_9PEZI